MENVITREEFDHRRFEVERKVEEGGIFIHPTDTIYGLGCDATNSEAVQKLRLAKERYTKPFSVIAPSKEWILENCVITDEADRWISLLPGPYTLILKLKNKDCVAPEVAPGSDSLGVRIPNHWFTGFAQEKLRVPIVTTSANIVGQEFMVSLDTLDSKIKSKVDFIIYEGEKSARPSKIVHLEDGEKVVER